ncbi:MAG: hypothetical protein H7141_09860 [Burkholderiales bacterium]|nr:hypothetical protein [Bacteroidia bacterium]
MKQIIFIYSLVLSLISFGQANCAYQLKQDSSTLLFPKTKELVDIIEVKIKNNYLVQFIKKDKKNYLKIIVRDDLGFGKKGSLLLVSAKKQIYVKSLTLEVIDKSSAYFLIELNNSYYLDNIKEFGLSKIVFNEIVEFGVPKPDSDQIKKAADCFFAIVKDNIWPPTKKL